MDLLRNFREKNDFVEDLFVRNTLNFVTLSLIVVFNLI